MEALGGQAYTLMQLMQTVGDKNVRIVPDVSVTGANAGGGLVDALIGGMPHKQTVEDAKKET